MAHDSLCDCSPQMISTDFQRGRIYSLSNFWASSDLPSAEPVVAASTAAARARGAPREMTAAPMGYAAPRNPRGQQAKKPPGYDPVCFRWDDSAAVTATALAAYAAEHAEALKKPRLPARIQNFLNEQPPRTEVDNSADSADEEFPDVEDGSGSKRFPDGTVYTGGFVGGLREGHGRYRSSLGAVYEGEWRAGVRCGRGMERYPIGNVYEGQFVNDKREGLGTMWYPGGDTYEGFYKAGKKEGRGKYRSASGALYEGEYRVDLRDGQGKERYPDGSVYEGGFKAGKRAGLGTMRYASGDVYVGPWKRDLRDGKGTFQYAGGARVCSRRQPRAATRGHARMTRACTPIPPAPTAAPPHACACVPLSRLAARALAMAFAMV